VTELLREVVGDAACPVIVMRSDTPNRPLVDRLKRYIALKNFTNDEKTKVSSDWYKTTLNEAERSLRSAIDTYRASCVAEAPSAFRAQIKRVAPGGLSGVLTEVIQMTYPSTPPKWYQNFKLLNPSLSNAVGLVSSTLLQSTRFDPLVLGGRKPDVDIVTMYLQSSWRLLNPSNQVVAPMAGTRLFSAWQEIESHFAPGAPSKTLKLPFETLLNAPYGFDWNTLALLFAAWRAFHRFDLVIDPAGHPLIPGGSIKPKQLLQTVSSWHIRRIDVSKLHGEIEDLVQAVKSGQQFARSEALSAVQKLQDFLGREGEEEALREKVIDVISRLQAGLSRAKQYDDEAKAILQDADRSNLQLVVQCLSRIEKLPTLTLVEAAEPTVVVLRNTVHRRIAEPVNRFETPRGINY
jgi:hypothetical protein